MSGEATLTPDDGSEEILIGKGDQVKNWESKKRDGGEKKREGGKKEWREWRARKARVLLR